MNISQKLNERIGEWQKQLLQLDRRNPLVHSSTSSRGLVLIESIPDKLAQRLEDTKLGLTFDHAEILSYNKDNPLEPNGYFYRIDLREYAVEVKKLEPEIGFMGYTRLEKSS